MSGPSNLRILDVTGRDAFMQVPPCADPRFDHRTCDYWEDGERGSKAARSSWLRPDAPTAASHRPRAVPANPFAPGPRDEGGFNPFAPPPTDPMLEPAHEPELVDAHDFNPFAPPPRKAPHDDDWPRKLRLLDRGRAAFGSYAKIAVQAGESVGYAQFGPLSAYPRARHIRELYPRLPQSPPPAVITCVATIPSARRAGIGQALVKAVVDDLGERGFAAVEAYPDLTLGPDEASAAYPSFWEACGFGLAVSDDRYPVMRLELT